jgi:hypothetical protein
MTILYKDEFINDARGIPHAVIDMDNSNFANDPTATWGMKTSPAFAFRGRAGQRVVTSQGDNVETAFTCVGGEVVFVNILPPNGKLDAYVPRDKQGNSTGEKILADLYDAISGNFESSTGGLYRPKPAPTLILLRVIEKPTVLVDAYGPGQHVFLEPEATLKISGSTLKISGSNVSGINPVAFDATWAVTDAEGNIVQPARPPSPDFYSVDRFQAVLKPR